MRYSDVESFLSAGLADKYEPLPAFSPGPSAILVEQKKAPGMLVFATFGAGLGTDSEEHFDRPFITIRALGPQRDFTGAESLAWDIDTLLLSVDGNRLVGTAKVLYIARTGGAPALIDHDAAERYHFQATYVVETQTGF